MKFTKKQAMNALNNAFKEWRLRHGLKGIWKKMFEFYLMRENEAKRPKQK